MEIATNLAPLGLALIMLGLGLSLTIQDFIRVVKIPKDFLVGFISQLVLLPIIALSNCSTIKITCRTCYWTDANCMCTWWCYIKCPY